MYRTILIIIAMLLINMVNLLQAEEKYEGDYLVPKPKNEVDFEEMLQKQQNINALNNVKEKEQTRVKALSKIKKDAERQKLKALQEEIKNKEKELEMQRQEMEAQQRELERQRKEQEMSLNKLRAESHFGFIKYTKDNAKHKEFKRPNSYNLEKNVASLPTNRNNIITNDMYIVGLLENAVNSEIGGRIVIVVEEDVYGAEGRNILIPKGSRIVCLYEPMQAGGQTRLEVVCNRILEGNGISVTLTNMKTADAMGRTGVIGKVDNRLLEKYGQVLGLSGISGLNTYATFLMNMSTNPNVVAGTPILQSTNNSLQDVTKQILKKTMSLNPIILVAAGSRVVLEPLVDIYFNYENNKRGGKDE